MKLDIKSISTLVVIMAALAAGAYSLGLSSAKNTSSSMSSQSVGNSSAPAHPSSTRSTTTETAASGALTFSHFRVGNRNVKGMTTLGDFVWVGTSGGVLKYDLRTDNYVLYDVSNGSLLSNGVFHLSVLDERIMVGTYGGGLSVFDTKSEKWKNYNIPDGLADQFVYDVQRVSNGDVWIATWSGVNRVKQGKFDDPTQWETYNLTNTNGGLPNDWVYGLEEGKNGEMWFATEKGVARFVAGKWENWQHEEGLGAAYELVAADIKFNNDPGKASKHHARQKVEDGLVNVSAAYNPNYVVSLSVDGDGIVWAGTWGGGLARYDGKKWTNTTVQEGLPSNHVFMLHRDNEGRIWAGTSEGLARVDQQTGKPVEIVRRKDGLFADNVFSMAKAQDGSVWVGSFGGVARLYGLI